MEQLISHGLASHYFVTDPERALAVVKSPLVLSSSSALEYETFADLLSKCVFAFEKTNFWHQLLKLADKVAPGSPEAIQKTSLWLQHLEHDGGIPFSGCLSGPLFVLSNGIEDRCLRILKRLKVRGTQILAVDVSANSEPTDVIAGLNKSLSGNELAKGQSFRLVEPKPSVVVVAGLWETVISSESQAAKILSERRQLAGSSSELDLAELI
jgi:hypothetical protein